MNNIKTKIKQVVIWGHRLHSHTHSYIHDGFFKAFQYLGYRTLWLDNSSILDSYDFSNTLFITEGQVDQNIPIVTNSYYILHNCDLHKYRNNYIHILLLQVYTKDCIKKQKIEKYIYYDIETEFPTLFMPWATDLLPEDIEKNIQNIEENVLKNKTNIVNFVGMITPEWLTVKLFCLFKDLQFTVTGGYNGDNVNSDINQKLIQQSYIAPAIQTAWQVEKGYIPCRIFKNISYGKMGITNNETVAELFNGNIIYHQNIIQTLELGMEFEKMPDYYKKRRIIYLMEYIKQKHTYLNRIKVLLNCLNI